MRNFNLLLYTLLLLSSAEAQEFTRTELPTELDSPWEITYGPDNYLWLTERGGKVVRVNPINGDKKIIFTATDFYSGSHLEKNSLCHQPSIGTGTFGLTLHPDFINENTSFIYFVYSYNSGTDANPATKFRIKRLNWNKKTEQVVSDTNVVNLISTGYDHLGGRLLAIKQNKVPFLFLTVGDNGISADNSPGCYDPPASNPNNFTQDPNTINGKVHRFNMDGSIPDDNPIPNNSFYTRGHRNPQGLMYNDRMKILYDVEHGDRTDDEINILYKGMNYGWKNVRGFHGDNSYPGEDAFVSSYVPHSSIANDSLVQPFYAWCTTPDTSDDYLDWCTVAPSDGIFYGSDLIKEWENSLLVVTLKDGLLTDNEVYQFKLNNKGELAPSTTDDPNPKKFFAEDKMLNGRLRDIAISNTGQKIFLINNGGTDRDKIIVYNAQIIIIDPEPISELNVVPNPTAQNLYIQGFNELENVRKIYFTNLNGALVYSTYAVTDRFDVSGLQSGIYFIHIVDAHKTHQFKFVKF